MSNLDDELALFESEISSLDTPSSTRNQNKSSGHSVVEKFEQRSASTVVVQPLKPPPLPEVVSSFMPPQLNRPMGNLIPPPMPPMGVQFPIGGLRPGMFVPHQLRPPPLRAPPTIIEGAPTLYKTEPVMAPPKPKTTVLLQALASDIEALQKMKDAEASSSQSASKADKPGKRKKYVRTAGGQIWEDNSLCDWDPNDFRIFCGDLGNEVSDELLAKAFRRFPSFQKAKVIRDKRSNKSKGFGFVSFKSQDDYVRAIREMDGKYVGNRPIKLRKSQWKDRQIEVVKKKIKQKTKLGMF